MRRIVSWLTEFAHPKAWLVAILIVAIGGLFRSTLLTLLVVPVISSLADDLRGRFGRRKREVAQFDDLRVPAASR